jgi:hypothetical protein
MGFRIIHGEPVLVREMRKRIGPSRKLVKLPGKLQQHRAPTVGVGDDLRLAQRLRVGDTLRIACERLLGISPQEHGHAPDGEAALTSIVAAEDKRLPAVPVDVVNRKCAIHMAASRLEITPEEMG